jgi:predicted site-specific integrase-resolvase
MQAHLSERELATRWAISTRTLQRWRPECKGPAYIKLGGRVVYPVSEIEKYEQQNRHGGESKPEAHARDAK